MRNIWLTIYLTVFVWSAIGPKEYFTWILEVIPAIIGFILLAATYNSFRLTRLVYTLILLHCIILFVGGHYTYAEVPLFDYLKEIFNWQRNNYDKVGHFVQGFVPAMIAREIIIQKKIITFPKWRNFFIVCFCLAFSAFYELVEWVVSILAGYSTEAFLGTQGYVWDTQSDMAFALLGAITALLFLSNLHDRQLRGLKTHSSGANSRKTGTAGRD
ncbi:MAG TPA: DUF2238 domain-containing protein [Desulfocapsa sulfexigens]|nr:DUF2238 domain-containing protein [Desulfocapsa sulfexigens]